MSMIYWYVNELSVYCLGFLFMSQSVMKFNNWFGAIGGTFIIFKDSTFKHGNKYLNISQGINIHFD